MIAILLCAGIVTALAVGCWNTYAGLGLSMKHDWRVDRTGLTAPGTDNEWIYLTLIAMVAIVVAVLVGAGITAILAIGFAYSILFAGYAIRSRRRAVIWFRGNMSPVNPEAQR